MGIAATRSGQGYFVMGSQGGPLSYGDAAVPSGDFGTPRSRIAVA